MELLSSTNPIDRAVTELPSCQKALRRVNRPCRIGGEAVTTNKEAREEWANQLALSVDGRDLTVNVVDAASHLWLEKPARVFPRLHPQGNSTQRWSPVDKSKRGKRKRDLPG